MKCDSKREIAATPGRLQRWTAGRWLIGLMTTGDFASRLAAPRERKQVRGPAVGVGSVQAELLIIGATS